MGEISLWIVFLKCTLDTIIGTPRKSYKENTSEVYSHSYSQFGHSRVIMNMKLSSHGFLFHRNINRRENRAQIPLITHHNEKKLISDVEQKIIELHKLVKWL